MAADKASAQAWRVHIAGMGDRDENLDALAKSCGAFESGYAGTLYFAFRDAEAARRFAQTHEQRHPRAAVIVVNV